MCFVALSLLLFHTQCAFAPFAVRLAVRLTIPAYCHVSIIKEDFDAILLFMISNTDNSPFGKPLLSSASWLASQWQLAERILLRPATQGGEKL
jgi:hypothetical protein